MTLKEIMMCALCLFVGRDVAVVFTSLCYNETGDMLAAGDKRGNVILLQSDESSSVSDMNTSTTSSGVFKSLFLLLLWFRMDVPRENSWSYHTHYVRGRIARSGMF